MVNDSVSDMLTRLRNATMLKKQTVCIPFTRLSQQICRILELEGFIDSFEVYRERELRLRLKYTDQAKKPCITNLRRISKPGVRSYSKCKDLPKILNGLGLVVLSTSQGVMTGQEARLKGLGGEILCSVW